MRFVLFLLFCGSLGRSYAQISADTLPFSQSKAFLLKIGSTTFRDNFLSPIRYQLPSIGAEMSYNAKKGKKLSTKLSTLRLGIPQTSRTLQIWSFEFQLHYAQHYQVVQQPSSSLYIGGFANLAFASRVSDIYKLGYGNNEVSVDAGSHIGLALVYAKSFSVLQYPILFQNTLNIPIISVLGRSGYAHDAYFKEELIRNLGKYIYVGSLNHFLLVQNKTYFDFAFKNKPNAKHSLRQTAWRLGIDWQFKSFDKPSELRFGNTSLVLGKVIIF